MNWSRVKVALLLVCGTMSKPNPNPDRNLMMRSEFTEPKFTPTLGLKKKKTRVNYHKVQNQKAMLEGEGQGRGPHPSSSRWWPRRPPLLPSLFSDDVRFFQHDVRFCICAQVWVLLHVAAADMQRR